MKRKTTKALLRCNSEATQSRHLAWCTDGKGGPGSHPPPLVVPGEREEQCRQRALPQSSCSSSWPNLLASGFGFPPGQDRYQTAAALLVLARYLLSNPKFLLPWGLTPCARRGGTPASTLTPQQQLGMRDPAPGLGWHRPSLPVLMGVKFGGRAGGGSEGRPPGGMQRPLGQRWGGTTSPNCCIPAGFSGGGG